MQSTKFQQLTAASDFCRLLAMFLNLPTLKVATGIVNGTLVQDFDHILQELDCHVFDEAELKKAFTSSESPDVVLHSLRQEYTRLFTHPEKPAIAIYEALFRYEKEGGEERPSLHVNPAALDAQSNYRRAGFNTAYAGNESADHMAREIEFLSYLYFQQARQLVQANDNTNYQELRQNFWRLHLQRWGKAFFQQCEQKAGHPAYICLGRLGQWFCQNE